MHLSERDVTGLIAGASEEQSSAFIVNEFDNYKIEFWDSQNITKHEVVVESGIGDTIEKEEWRGDIVANLFYPSDGNKHKAVVHINGSVPLMQDGRYLYLYVTAKNQPIYDSKT